MKRALISGLTLFSVIAPVGVASASTPVAERIDGYHVRAEVEADRMQFENCMDRLNQGLTTLQYCVPQWAPSIVVETTTTTTTTTIPTTETTAPPVTSPPTTTAPAPTTTVAPAPTTTAPPADPVEACIEDFSGCLNPEVRSFINGAWTIPYFNPPFPNVLVDDGVWYGGCKSSECTFFATQRTRAWEAPEKPSFALFTDFANNWCPVNPGQEDNSYYVAQCNSGHFAGGSFEVKWDGGELTVKWSIGVAVATGYGYDSWADWYRTEGHLNY